MDKRPLLLKCFPAMGEIAPGYTSIVNCRMLGWFESWLAETDCSAA